MDDLEPDDGNESVDPGPVSMARRRVLLGLGFGAANLVLLRKIGRAHV